MKLLAIMFPLAIGTVLSSPLNLVYPHVHPFPSASFAYEGPVHIVHAVPAVETRLHYAETPLVVGHSVPIVQPQSNSFVLAPLVAPVAYAAPATLNEKASVPACDALPSRK